MFARTPLARPLVAVVAALAAASTLAVATPGSATEPTAEPIVTTGNEILPRETQTPSRSFSRPALTPASTADATRRHTALAAEARSVSQLIQAEKAEAARAAAKKAAAQKRKAKALGYQPGTKDPRSIARQMMKNKYGWGADQFSCYNTIIMAESRWIVTADNPTSSAYGIPQALPGKKMASAGADWRTNPATQIKWGLGYVKDRFGTPCQALSFRKANGWY